MNKQINIEIFSKTHKTTAAKKGLSVLRKLIANNDDYSLNELLRDHRERGIRYFFEIEYRDDIDYLLEYYSLIQIGIMSGYFPSELTRPLINEIKLVLSIQQVRIYYKDYYPLLLPQILLKNVENLRPINQVDDITSQDGYFFEQLLIINDSIRFDEDVDQFLWFLDDGVTGPYSISDFWLVLEDVNRIEYKLATTNSHPLNHALWGFIKYLEFLHEYAELLRQLDNSRLLQSAFWNFQSYWFAHIENKLRDILEKGISNIRKAVENANQHRLIQNENSYIENEGQYMDWRESIQSLNAIENDISFLRDPRLRKPLLLELER